MFEPANKGNTYPVEVLAPDEVRRLIMACSASSSLGLRNRALITVLYRAGLRISEALDLRVKDVDMYAGSIAVLRGKGNRRRTVGVDAGALAVIKKWIDRRRELGLPQDAPFLCSLRGRPLSSSYMRELLPRLAHQVGIQKRVHPHGLRHTHAYELMMENVPMPIIQRQLGHASLATTDTYLSHIAPRDVINAMKDREWEL